MSLIAKQQRFWRQVGGGGGAGGGGLDTAWHCSVAWTEQLLDLAGPLMLSRSTKSQLLVRKIREECTVEMKQSGIVKFGDRWNIDCTSHFGWNRKKPFHKKYFHKCLTCFNFKVLVL